MAEGLPAPHGRWGQHHEAPEKTHWVLTVCLQGGGSGLTEGPLEAGLVGHRKVTAGHRTRNSDSQAWFL